MKICSSNFWDWNLTWNTHTPYFTPCFENTVLASLPLCFLLVFGWVDIWNITRSKDKIRSWKNNLKFLNLGKLSLNLILVLLNGFNLIVILLYKKGITASDWLSPTFAMIGHILALFLCILTKREGIHSSGAQFFYWLITFLSHLILFRTAVNSETKSQDNELSHSLRIVFFPIISLRFMFEFFNDITPQAEEQKGTKSPEKSCTFFSKIFFLWYDSMAWKGYRSSITMDNLWELNEENTSKYQYDQFRKYWTQAQMKAKKVIHKNGTQATASILSPLLKSYGQTLGFGTSLKIIADLLVFVQPFIIRALVSHVTNVGEESWKGYFYVAVITVTSATASILSSCASRRAWITAMRIKTAISNAVYDKTLKISNTSRKETSSGEILNLMNVDATKLSHELLPTLNTSISSPLVCCVAVILLYQTLGSSVFAGIGIMILIIPTTLGLVTISKKYQKSQMKFKDERIKVISEVLAGIKVLKLYAWEQSFRQRIEEIRRKELKYLRRSAFLITYMSTFNQAAPVFVAVATLITYVLMDPSNVLDAEKTFVALTLFNIMRNPVMMFPVLFSNVIQALVSIKRLNKYLNMEELNQNTVTHDNKFVDPIIIQNATLGWNPTKPVLKNLNLNIKQGDLIAIVGGIGSGKSSLLHALLGDLIKMGGSINVNGSIGYVSQTAWIQNATLMQNILFQNTYQKDRYDKILDVCALRPDLKQLPDGDQTEIGENGINLSGGQKQRVALARAAYKNADVYILDDPLSAVDTHVGKLIWDELIGPSGLLSEKTRVLVTHSVCYLPFVDKIIVMKNGEISDTGKYEELRIQGGEFAEFLQQHIGAESEEKVTQANSNNLQSIVDLDLISRKNSSRALKKNTCDSDWRRTPTFGNKLVEIETVSEGNIKGNVFCGYMKAAGFLISIIALSFNIFSNGVSAYSNVWLAEWTNTKNKEELNNYYIIGYLCIGISQGVIALIGNIALAIFCLNASFRLHSVALQKVIRAPMSYFDTTLTGRLINRFSKDVDTLDNTIPYNIRLLAMMLFGVLSVFVIISYTTPIFIAFIIPMIIIYIFMQRFYTATSRQLKRLDGISRSPIYSHFSETVNGVGIIRAFGLQKNFMTEFEAKIDQNHKAFFPYAMSNMWIAIRLELMGVVIIFATCVFVLLSRNTMSPGSAGLAISYSFQITVLLNLIARQMSELESNIVSVERIHEMTQVPQEADLEILETKPSDAWPKFGEVKFENYSTRYRPGLDLVLRGLTCTFLPAQKIGVVGRTGAGKTSLTLSLFRLIEKEVGLIHIDGIDISKIGLHDLRSKITIIPQDPLLFSGSLRSNLDPFNKYSDAELWNSLELSHLKQYVSLLDGQLEHDVEEEGKNFSVGQRQLICLARALLRHTKILVLDEATASVDIETDELIQATIRKEFLNSTVITIAHRLNTIIDSNTVLVLDNGKIQEFDTPENLLQDSKSIFWKMAHDAKLV